MLISVFIRLPVAAYEHEIYGDQIIIERRISAGGSNGYKIKNADGKKISDSRKELLKILDHYNIQVCTRFAHLSARPCRLQCARVCYPFDHVSAHALGLKLRGRRHIPASPRPSPCRAYYCLVCSTVLSTEKPPGAQVDNPCSVLGQGACAQPVWRRTSVAFSSQHADANRLGGFADESKKLAVGKSEDKYDFYLRASGLKSVRATQTFSHRRAERPKVKR